MTEAFRPTPAEEFLNTNGINRNLSQPGWTNAEKLQLMVETGVPIESDTANNLLRRLASEEDMDSIRIIHELGEGHLLAQTTIILFDELLKDEKDERTAVEKFNSILTEDVVKRGRTDFRGKDSLPTFINELISSFWRDDENPRTLRDLLLGHHLDQETELEIERLLADRFPESVEKDFEQQRKDWLTQLKPFDEVLADPEASDESKRIVRLRAIDNLIRQRTPESLDQARELLKSTNYSDHAEILAERFTPALLEIGRLDLVRDEEKAVKDGLDALEERPHNNYPYYGLATSQMQSADSQGFIESLKTANKKGLDKLRSNLGVTEDQLGLIFIWSRAEDTHHEFHASLLYSLLIGEYQNNEFSYKYSYSELLKRRILLLGEEGIKYPPSEKMSTDAQFVMKMGQEYALRRDVDGTKRWIERAKGLPGGKNKIRYLINQM